MFFVRWVVSAAGWVRDWVIMVMFVPNRWTSRDVEQHFYHVFVVYRGVTRVAHFHTYVPAVFQCVACQHGTRVANSP